MDDTKNLTNPIDIRYAIERKDGRVGAMSRLAAKLNVQRTALSMNINGHRRQEYILIGVANYLGCTVYGVQPEPEVLKQKKYRSLSN